MRSVLTSNYVMFRDFFSEYMKAMAATIPLRFPCRHRIGSGRKDLWTVWRPVLRGSRSDNPAYRKPVIAGSTESARRLSPNT